MIVLGLDGATFSLIRPWVEAGHLPTFARLLDESVHGDLESTVPEITVPAWPAFATGRRPESLDMFGFTHFNRETRELDLSHDTFVPGKMWDAVDDQGGRSVVFNIPGSYPWQEIDGTIVAAAPEYKDEYSHPPERWDELVDLLDGYRLRNDANPGTEAYVETSLDLVEKRFRAFEHLIDDEEPDLAVGLIRATDRVAHHFWGTEPVETNALFRVYRAVDERLGEFLDAHADEDVVVMSDHGFEKVTAKFAPNYVLREAGLVALTASGDSGKAALGRLRDVASDVLGRVGLLTLARRLIPESALTDVPSGGSLGLDNALSLGRIDWERTRALADIGQKTTMVYALADDPDAVETVCADVEEALGAAAEREGLAVRFRRLRRGGPHTPDLAMVIETPEVHATSRFDVGAAVIEADTSGHARDGVFLARGPSFRTGDLEGAEIVDVAPTVLHAMGLQVPASVEGEVLDVFADGTPAAESGPEYYDFIGGEAATAGGVGDDDDREAEVKDRLRELGYLE
jgi:predicted AlkP superfamily phosphohydrolase/phosphomutase